MFLITTQFASVKVKKHQDKQLCPREMPKVKFEALCMTIGITTTTITTITTITTTTTKTTTTTAESSSLLFR